MTEEEIDQRDELEQQLLHARARCNDLVELLRETLAAVTAAGVEIDEGLAADVHEALGG